MSERSTKNEQKTAKICTGIPWSLAGKNGFFWLLGEEEGILHDRGAIPTDVAPNNKLEYDIFDYGEFNGSICFLLIAIIEMVIDVQSSVLN